MIIDLTGQSRYDTRSHAICRYSANLSLGGATTLQVDQSVHIHHTGSEPKSEGSWGQPGKATWFTSAGSGRGGTKHPQICFCTLLSKIFIRRVGQVVIQA